MRKVRFDARKPQLLATIMMTAFMAACSSDVMRFGDDPFASPYQGRPDPATTQSIRNRGTKALEPVSTAPVTTQALPPASQPMIRQNAPLHTGSVAAPAYPALAPVAARQPSVVGNANGWTAAGGTPVTLQQGENLNSLSARYGVPVNAIMAVNGLSSVNQVQPGQQVVIPAYNPVTGGRSAPVAQASAPIQKLPEPARQMIPPKAVSEAPRAQQIPQKTASAARAVVPAAESEAEKRAAAKLREIKAMPDAREDTRKRAEEAKKKAEAEALAQKKATLAKLEASRAETARNAAAKKAKAQEEVETTASIPEQKLPPKAPAMPAKPEPAKEAALSESAGGEEASFRWPAKGRVISGFGARGTGGSNDGINIALPEGTPVRAAEGGTVVHADDALKGYGKLVLIRHPNGFVSVYAHNGELNVKRGESVKRGQVIAKSGQTGNVTAPQLHFELRKGSTPVDPTKLLSE